jgi:ankyrin repeat protein
MGCSSSKPSYRIEDGKVERTFSSTDSMPSNNDTSLVVKLRLPVAKMRIEDPIALKEVLIENPDSLHGRDSDECTPLHYACVYGLTDVARVLLDAGAMINYRDKQGDTPLHKACAWQRMDTVALLVSRGAELEGRNANGMTPFLWACRRGNVELAAFLMEKGCEVDVRENKRRGAADIAIDNREAINDLVCNHRTSVTRRTATWTRGDECTGPANNKHWRRHR